MSRKRKFETKYPWGSERPGLALARAQKHKEKLLQQIETIRERKRQETEKAIAAKQVLIDEADLVIALATEHQIKPPQRRRKRDSSGNSDAQMAGISSQHPDISHDQPRKSEAPVEQTTLSSSDNRVKLPHQGTWASDALASGTDRVRLLSVPAVNTPIVIEAATSDKLPNETFGPSAFGFEHRQHVTVAQQKAIQFEATEQAEAGNCLPSQDEMQPPRHECSIEKQHNDTRAADRNPTPESQKLMKRQRELEDAFDDFCHRFGDDQSGWPAEAKAKAGRLDQELTAISILLASALASRKSVS
ncbi:hypothetical protein [Microvirga sp. BSC39]|uniref:hypothetical protein n=1 Tax=Microvirga sp. BSC39 TaxID=1549810 RepID=UPI0004E8E79D|nr:hypothetical protein [Microvirga sp. BSC39]KFG68849.1 hypothetical protein JH26_14015 [Microvirga sp. BSC39]